MLSNKQENEVTSQFQPPAGKENSYTGRNEKIHRAFMEQDLARSGLEPHELNARVHPFLALKGGAQAGYCIPYYDLKGELIRQAGDIVMYSLRLHGGEQRYDQPTGEYLDSIGLPRNIPYVLPDTLKLLEQSDTLYICEGEKKAASFVKYLNLPAIGIGGCWCWQEKDKQLHPWIQSLIEHFEISKVVVIPDGDIQKYQIASAYGTFASELTMAGVSMETVRLPPGAHGIDDLLVEWGVDAEGMFEALKKSPADDLVVAQEITSARFGLSTTGEGKGLRIVPNENNIARILGRHPAFKEGFWYNTDNATMMVGERVLRLKTVGFELMTFMQHNLQMHQIKKGPFQDTVKSVCALKERSPLREHIKAVKWDFEERLETWAIRLWGCPDTAVTREVSKKFFVGKAARLLTPGCKMDWMLVTTGAQGIGKTWFADLCCYGNGVNFLSTGNVKDDLAMMHHGNTICIDELDAFSSTKRDKTYFKTLITSHEDTYRKPFDVEPETYPRNSTLYGTTNHHTFLPADDTGHRRYGPLGPTRMLDFKGLRGELDQLYAEAVWVVENEVEYDYYALSDTVREYVEDAHAAEDPLAEALEDFMLQHMGDMFQLKDVRMHLDGMDNLAGSFVWKQGEIRDKLIGMGCWYFGKDNKQRIGNYTTTGYKIDRDKWPRGGKESYDA